jgi:integrase
LAPAIAVAYGAGLRAAQEVSLNEVVSLKVGDIDSKRTVIRVEFDKVRKDRYVMPVTTSARYSNRAAWRGS